MAGLHDNGFGFCRLCTSLQQAEAAGWGVSEGMRESGCGLSSPQTFVAWMPSEAGI